MSPMDLEKVPLKKIAVAVLAILHCTWIPTISGQAGSQLQRPSPQVIIEETRDLGTISAPQGIQGRDGGYSARFNGKSIWVYGDTILSENAGMHANSWSWTDDLVAGDGIDRFKTSVDPAGTPLPLLLSTEKERAFNRDHLPTKCGKPPCGSRWALWPGALVPDPGRNRLLVFYEKIRVKPGFLNFETAGHSVAVWQKIESPATRPVFNRVIKHPTLMFDANEPGFGTAAVIVGTRLYIFGCDTTETAKPCRLARVPLARALDRTAWRFFAASGQWREEIHKSAPVFEGNDILSVSFNPSLNRFLAVYSRPMGTAVLLRTARAPEGPWSAPVHAFDAMPPANDIGWIYDAQEHAEYARDGGRRIFITYSRQTAPDAFEMRLVSVTLSNKRSP